MPDLALEALQPPRTPLDALAQGMRFTFRSARLALHVLTGLMLACVVNLDYRRRIRPEPLVRWWSLRMMRIIHLRLTVHGDLPDEGCVLMANHVSWLDIPLIGASTLTRFVSKSEVRDWPVAGWLANASGTFYLRRGKGASRPLLLKLVPHVQDGGSVTIFPEGTTTDGSGLRPFFPRLFAAAIESHRPVVPVTLRYGPGDGGQPIAPFIGDDDLFSHILRLLKNRELTATVSFGAPISPVGRSREQMAEATFQSISRTLAA